MKFLKTTIEEINKYFEPLPKDSFFYEELSESKKIIHKAIKYYKVEYCNKEVFEKIPITFSEYNSQDKTHFSKWNLNYLKENLILSDLKKEIIQDAENTKEKFIHKLDEKLLNLFTDLQIKNELNELIEQINDSISSLEKLTANKYQKIIINTFIESYKLTLIYLNTKYEKYLPQIDKQHILRKLFIHNKIDTFLTLETQLIERNFISKSGIKLNWIENKIKMVSFCRLLKSHNYTKEFISVERIINFLEERYNINTGDQAKPSKYSKKSVKLIEADFFFLNF